MVQEPNLLSVSDANRGRLTWEAYIDEFDAEKLSDYLVALDLLDSLIMTKLRDRHLQVQTSES
jgi:hypothetical protein